jgi:integrase
LARTLRDAKLESRTARLQLKPEGKRFWRAIDSGLHLGYRRGKSGGVWLMRRYLGGEQYILETIARADDALDPDGDVILSFAQAQAKARKLFMEREREDAGLRPTSGPYLVEHALADYLAAYKGGQTKGGGKRPEDIKSRSQAFIEPELGKMEVARLTADRIRKWHAALAEAAPRLRTAKGEKQRYAEPSSGPEAIRRRRASANRTLTTLKAALNHAFQASKVGNDAAWRQVKPYRETNAARARYLTIAEAKRLINTADAKSGFRSLVQAALLTGCRYGELGALEVADFNPDSSTIHIRTSKSGKGRHVVLSDEGVRFFKELCLGRSSGEPMLRRGDGERWGIGHQTRLMSDACKSAKINPAASFHALRHTYASHSVMNGAPLLVAAKNLGHADTRMVEKHYGHLAPSFIADAIRAAAPRFGIKAKTNVVDLEARKRKREALATHA